MDPLEAQRLSIESSHRHEASKPWVERTFGESWETSLAAYGGGGLGTLLILLSSLLKISELMTPGLALLGGAVVAIGAMARTQAQHRRDKEQGKT